MAFTLWALLEAGLLIVNAICVLHEQRFLAKGKSIFIHLPNIFENNSESCFRLMLCINYDSEYMIYFLICIIVGWASSNARGFGEPQGVKDQVMNIIHSTRTVMRST